MNKEEYLKNKIEEYCKIFKIPKLTIEKMEMVGVVMYVKPPFLSYNKKEIKNISKPEILLTILHELAHIKFKHYEGKEKFRELYEKKAEFWALEQIQKHEPKVFDILLKELLKKKGR